MTHAQLLVSFLTHEREAHRQHAVRLHQANSAIDAIQGQIERLGADDDEKRENCRAQVARHREAIDAAKVNASRTSRNIAVLERHCGAYGCAV